MENRLALLQRLCHCYIIFFFANIVLVSGCSNETDPLITPAVADEQTTDSSVLIVSEGELTDEFQELQKLFPSPILDEGFKTLHEISESDVYLKFLRNAYPNVPHENLNTFFKNSLPDRVRTQLYTGVLKKHFGRATEKDIRAVHDLHRAFQSTRIFVYHGTSPEVALDERLLPILQDGRAWKWIEAIFPKDEDAFNAFDIEFQQLSRYIEFENLNKINRSLQDHDRKGNRDAAFLWLLLTDPVLMGHILQDFTDTEIFHEWLKGEFIVNPIELPTR